MLNVKAPQLKGELGVIPFGAGERAEKNSRDYLLLSGALALRQEFRCRICVIRKTWYPASRIGARQHVLPRDEHFLSLVLDAPRGLPIARVRWSTGKADRDYQRAGSNEISPHRTSPL